MKEKEHIRNRLHHQVGDLWFQVIFNNYQSPLQYAEKTLLSLTLMYHRIIAKDLCNNYDL